MNIKKLFGLLACAAVSAVAINAYANTTTNWFGASASNTDLVLTSATTNGASITVSDSKITIYNDYSALLSVKPKPEVESPALNDGLVTITSSAYLAPSSTNNLPVASTISDAQVGFAVAYDDTNATNYYYYVRTGNSKGTWTKWAAPTVPAEGTDTSFTITIDYRVPSATFTIGEYSVTCNSSPTTAFVPGVTALNDVAAFGSGSISSIGVDYEVAVAGYNNVKYGSVLEAVQAATAANANASAVVTYDDKGATVESNAENGLTKAECAALGIEEDAAVSLAPLAAADQTDNENILLSTTVGAGYTVTFNVVNASSEVVSKDCPANAIEIPREAGTYTIVPTITATAE